MSCSFAIFHLMILKRPCFYNYGVVTTLVFVVVFGCVFCLCFPYRYPAPAPTAPPINALLPFFFPTISPVPAPAAAPIAAPFAGWLIPFFVVTVVCAAAVAMLNVNAIAIAPNIFFIKLILKCRILN